MKTKVNSTKKQETSCYYKSYSLCGCHQCTQYNKACIGCEACEYYISENDYFLRVMEGKINPEDEKLSKPKASMNSHKNLQLGKSKKALKKEAKLEAEKNQSGSGFSLKDDPRFKDLFQ